MEPETRYRFAVDDSGIPVEEPDSVAKPDRAVGEDFGITEELDFRSFWQTIKRRKGVLLSSIVLITLATAVAVFQLTPRYTASAKLILDTRETNVVEIEQVLGGLEGDSAAMESERQVLVARGLARKVVEKLDLLKVPEFNTSLKPPSFLSQMNPLTVLPESWRRALRRSSGNEQSITEEERQERLVQSGVDRLLAALEVEPEGKSRVLTVSATSEDPRLAQKIANTLVDFYLADQVETKLAATRDAAAWLNEHVEELRDQVEASESAVEEYRNQVGLTKGKDVGMASQQVSEINTQLILARAKSAEASARLRQVERLRKSPAGVGSAAEVLASPLIQRLREQEAQIERRAAEMATEFGPKHPKMININAEILDLRAKIESEVDRVVAGLRNELDVARTRERLLERNLNELRTEVSELDSAQIRLRALEREAAANRALFSTFLERLKETSQQPELQKPDARIISRASTPASPSFPKTRPFIAMGFLSSLIIGIVLIFVIENFDPGFRSSEQIEQLLGSRTLTLSPLLTGWKALRTPPQEYVISKPASAYSESLRTLYTGLMLTDKDDRPRAILVASSLPREGKTTLAASLARLMALSGKKVLLVDADIRGRQLAASLGLKNRPGLADLLMAKGDVPPKKVIQADTKTSLDFISAGSRASSPPDLFASARMKRIFASLREEYELIVVDSPPILAVSDARILARLTDRALFLIQWAATRREVARMALKSFQQSGADIAGVVLTKVNVRKHAQYGYGDSGIYHGRLRRYYID